MRIHVWWCALLLCGAGERWSCDTKNSFEFFCEILVSIFGLFLICSCAFLLFFVCVVCIVLFVPLR